MYELGDIVSCRGNFYITFMYKGKYYCGDIRHAVDISRVSSHWCGYKMLSELKERSEDEDDTEATVVFNREHGIEPAKVGDIYNRMMLFKKKKGRLVWVRLGSLEFHDLNELLHLKKYYYKNGEEKEMFKCEIMEAE